MVAALGGKDYVSVWTIAEQTKSVVAIENLTSGILTDLSWSRSAELLAVSGEDARQHGIVRLVCFPPNFFANSPLRKSEVKMLRKKISSLESVPEPLDVFSFDHLKEAELPEVPITIPLSMPSQTIGSSKKKRITPTLLSAPAPVSTQPPVSAPAEPELPPRPEMIANEKRPKLEVPQHPVTEIFRRKSRQKSKRRIRLEKALARARKRQKVSDGEEENGKQMEYVEHEIGVDENEMMDVDQDIQNGEGLELRPNTLLFEALPSQKDLELELETTAGIKVNASIHRDASVADSPLLTVKTGSIVAFRDIIPGDPVSMELADSFVAVATANSKCILYSLQGRKLSAPIFLEKPVARIVSNGTDRLLIIDCNGQASMLICHPELTLEWRSSLQGPCEALAGNEPLSLGSPQLFSLLYPNYCYCLT